MQTETGNKTAPLQITEDEAAVYDRQIRLWGLEAQQRMRNATILVVKLKGVATETLKNIVLAGVGKVIVIDGDDVSEEDLGAGFFFRDEDVGKNKVTVAKSRIESLNPLVNVEIIPSWSELNAETLEKTIEAVDVVCLTDWDRDGIFRVNDICRKCKKPLYAGGSYGLLGYIFCDLLQHEYLPPDRSTSSDEPQRRAKVTVDYCPLRTALKPYKWSGLSRMQTKNFQPTIVFTILSLWELQSRHGNLLPNDTSHAAELESIASTMFNGADVNKVIKSVPKDLIEATVTTAAHEFTPVCAIIGGILAQDILKMLGARDPPIANFFVFDGNSGQGSVCRMNMR